MQDVHATLKSHADTKQYWKSLLKFKTTFTVKLVTEGGIEPGTLFHVQCIIC